MPPEIVQTIPSIGDDFVIPPSGQIGVVISTDSEGDPLEFFWEISRFSVIGSEPLDAPHGDEYASKVVVEADPAFDGETLTCTTRDGFGGSVEASWPIVLEQAL